MRLACRFALAARHDVRRHAARAKRQATGLALDVRLGQSVLLLMVRAVEELR